MSLNTRRKAATDLMRQSRRVSLGDAAEKEVAERLEQLWPTRPAGVLPRSLRRSIARAQGQLPLKKRAARNRHPILVYPTWQKGDRPKGVPTINPRLHRSRELQAAIAERERVREREAKKTEARASRIHIPRFAPGDILRTLQSKKA